MIKTAMKYVHKGMKSHFAAKLAGVSENELAAALEDEAVILREIETAYSTIERPKVEQNIRDFLEEFPSEEKRRIRMSLLIERMKKAKQDKDITYLKSLVGEYQVLMGLAQDIDVQKVLRAREYPITSLIKNRNGMALCPFHKDTTPSMDVRKNFYHCYGCGETGDVIDFVMKTENLTFRQAVAKLG